MYVQSLKLEHIKAFDKLELDFTHSAENASTCAGINVFVGGNSSGKSTLLKCIAMALSGPTTASLQLISPAGWVRRGQERGAIEVKIYWDSAYDTFRNGNSLVVSNTFRFGLAFEEEPGGGTASIRAKSYQTSPEIKTKWAGGGPWNPDANGWLLGAYGPLRRMTGSSTEAQRYASGRGKLASCVTLFREDAALNESETWLKQEYARALEQKSENQSPPFLVEQAQAFLNDGLLLPGFRIQRITLDHVYMQTPNGGELPMRDLSDGFRSVFALMLDITRSIALAYPGEKLFEEDKQGRLVVKKPGVILIDEIEAHLHPSWQRTICEWLKARFPLVQFFITTHSPLIAQAADEGGLFVLPLPDEIAEGQKVRRLLPHEQKRISLGSAEKVLLGEAFGLKHTWSPRAERLVEKWERLAAKRNAIGSLPPAEEQDYTELSKQVEITFDDLPEEALHA